MKISKILSSFLTFSCMLPILAGCNNNPQGSQGQSSASSGGGSGEHETITINAPYKNIDNFIDLVHEKYPEINIEVEAYSGLNTTGWMRSMLRSGELTDIYFTTMYSAENDIVSDKLLDVSGYDFTDNYVQARLREVTKDGAVYMLPLSYGCYGITYNKTLLDRNGWTLPKNLKEMEELKVKVEAAGYDFCMDLIQYPGYGFQYLCNILDTGFLSTTDGLRWQTAYLNGTAKVSDTPEMLENIEILSRWKEIGLLTGEHTNKVDSESVKYYLEGNTLFCIGHSTDFSREEDDVTDEYKLMPYLSEDGDQNVFIMNVNRYVGLNKHLADKGNEQKLQDVLHVMEILSTEEGMWALNNQKGSALLPLKDVEVTANSYYSDVLEELNSGHTAPFIYAGWDNVIVPIGEVMLGYIADENTLQDVIDCIDNGQNLLASPTIFTTATETFDTSDCAKLVGICFAQAAGADLALISQNEYHRGDLSMNWHGTNGSLFAGPVDDQVITSFLPTGWNYNIETVTLTGARIKELVESGYDRHDNGSSMFPYELTMKEGTELVNDKVYKVAICGASKAVKEEGNIQDTGILGLDAMKQYLSQFETISKKDLVWR